MLWFGVAAFVKNQNSYHIMIPYEAIPDDGKEVTCDRDIVENQVGKVKMNACNENEKLEMK